MKRVTITWANVLSVAILVILVHAIICSVKSAKVFKITKPYVECVNTIRESTDIETLSTSLSQAKSFLEDCGYTEWMCSVDESIEGLNYLKDISEAGSDRVFTEMESYKKLLNQKDFVTHEELHKLDEYMGASGLYSSVADIFCSWAFVVVIIICTIAVIFEMELYDAEIITFGQKEVTKAIN